MGLNNYLSSLASTYHISYGTTERGKIQSTADNVVASLKRHFEDDVDEVKIFGSFTRNTILPRYYDPKSDIDILVQFNHRKLGVTPETYRNYLKSFARSSYPRSIISKDFPSVTIDLNHVKLDLVPCKFEGDLWGLSGNLYIPDNGNGWRMTDPDGFTADLTEVNQRYGQIVKPIIRLMKAWNSKAGSPFDSFELEKQIASMNFNNDNIESGFYWAIDNLSTSALTYTNAQKADTLRNNKKWVLHYLNLGDEVKAKQWLHKILP